MISRLGKFNYVSKSKCCDCAMNVRASLKLRYFTLRTNVNIVTEIKIFAHQSKIQSNFAISFLENNKLLKETKRY